MVGLYVNLFLPAINYLPRALIVWLVSQMLGHNDQSLQKSGFQNCSHVAPEFMISAVLLANTRNEECGEFYLQQGVNSAKLGFIVYFPRLSNL